MKTDEPVRDTLNRCRRCLYKAQTQGKAGIESVNKSFRIIATCPSCVNAGTLEAVHFSLHSLNPEAVTAPDRKRRVPLHAGDALRLNEKSNRKSATSVDSPSAAIMPGSKAGHPCQSLRRRASPLIQPLKVF